MLEPSLTLDQRISINLATRRYLRAGQKLQSSTAEFEQACDDLRSKLPPTCRCVVEMDYRNWLLQTDAERNIDIQEIDVI